MRRWHSHPPQVVGVGVPLAWTSKVVDGSVPHLVCHLELQECPDVAMRGLAESAMVLSLVITNKVVSFV